MRGGRVYMLGYRVATPAKRDFVEILDHLLNEAGPRVALDLEIELHKAFRLLAAYPGLGHLRQDLTPKAARFYLVGHYLLVYRNESGTIVIFAILHSSRNIKSVLSKRSF